jgi:hypothetical protein
VLPRSRGPKRPDRTRLQPAGTPLAAFPPRRQREPWHGSQGAHGSFHEPWRATPSSSRTTAVGSSGSAPAWLSCPPRTVGAAAGLARSSAQRHGSMRLESSPPSRLPRPATWSCSRPRQSLTGTARQHELAAWELCAREAKARPRDAMAELNRRLGIDADLDDGGDA